MSKPSPQVNLQQVFEFNVLLEASITIPVEDTSVRNAREQAIGALKTALEGIASECRVTAIRRLPPTVKEQGGF